MDDTHLQLEELTGIGPASADALRAVDVASVEALASCDPDDLAAKLAVLYEEGNSKTNWESHAAEWIDTARATPGGRSQTMELSSFTLRFETAVKNLDGTEVRNHACYVYDEQGAGEEVELDVAPREWARFILERSSLPESVVDRVAVDLDQHQPEHDHKVRVTKEIDDDGATTLRLTTEVDDDEREVVFVILADDGSTAYSADVLDSNEVTVPCTMFKPGLYRSFAWVRDRPEGPDFHTPVCGPVIRVSA